jgi:hypothetical protein
MRQDCGRPVPLPDRQLTQREVETLWAADRGALLKCGVSKAGLVTYYQALAGGLAAANRSQ